MNQRPTADAGVIKPGFKLCYTPSYRDGLSPLHYACLFSSDRVPLPDITKQRTDGVITSPAKGDTPLHSACRGGHKEIVSLLLEKGADVNRQNSWYETPLHIASTEGHLEVVRLLLKRGADVEGLCETLIKAGVW